MRIPLKRFALGSNKEYNMKVGLIVSSIFLIIRMIDFFVGNREFHRENSTKNIKVFYFSIFNDILFNEIAL